MESGVGLYRKRPSIKTLSTLSTLSTFANGKIFFLSTFDEEDHENTYYLVKPSSIIFVSLPKVLNMPKGAQGAQPFFT